MENKQKPILSVIVLSYNTKDITLKCLDDLKKSIDFLGKPVETIVIENGTDGTGKVVKQKYPWVKLLVPEENLGFAKGNNLGIESSNKNSKYYLFLNSDAFVESDTLLKSVDFMEKQKDCAVLGCKFKFGNGNFQPSAGFLPNPFSIFTWITGVDLIPVISKLWPQFHPKYKDFFAKDRKVGWVMGAYLFMKSEVVNKTLGFDDHFFNYMEEVEWCRRIQKAGFNIYYSPSFEITHLDKASAGGDSRIPTIKEIEGIIYYIKKYYTKSFWWLILTIKFAVFSRRFGFLIIGNKYRSNIYREVWKTL